MKSRKCFEQFPQKKYLEQFEDKGACQYFCKVNAKMLEKS